jgi:PDDEXK-like domain of unknown function (DUF3799)
MLSKEYLNNPRMSQSKLKIILDGIEEFKHNLDNPKEPSDEQNLGSAVHILILEPEKSNLIVKMPKINGATRKGKIFKLLQEGKGPNYFPVTSKTKKQEEGQFYEVDSEEMEFILQMGTEYGAVFTNPDQFIALSETEYEQAHRMAEATFKNEDTNIILKSCQHYEKTHHFDYMGISFKCQLDGQGHPFILDLKTTAIKNNDFIIKNEIRNRRYHFQAALYSKIFGDNIDLIYYILFVRNVVPYAVFPIQLSQELLDEGRYQLDEACTIYNHCLENNPEFIPNNRLRII